MFKNVTKFVRLSRTLLRSYCYPNFQNIRVKYSTMSNPQDIAETLRKQFKADNLRQFLNVRVNYYPTQKVHNCLTPYLTMIPLYHHPKCTWEDDDDLTKELNKLESYFES